MKKQLLLIAVLVLGVSVANAQTTPPTPKPGSVDETIANIKKPVDWFSWGADFRIRNEYYNNIVSLNETAAMHEQDVIRFRARLWGAFTPSSDFNVNVRLAAEPREWIRPAFVTAYKGEDSGEWRYGIFDNMNFKWGNIFGLPLTLTAGRQEILLGDFYDWWLVADGTPNDGSWTLFLDSIRLGCDLKDIKTKLDFIYIYQNPFPSATIPTFGSSTQYPLTDQLEQGFVLYASNKSINKTQLDGYFIYKNDVRKTFFVKNAFLTPGDNADIYTMGGKITGTPFEHWQYSVEGAYQCGSKEDTIGGVFARRDIDAFGGKAKLTYLFNDPLNNQLSLATEFLSGDDPNTGKDEMFDVLWGRWPRWSELYIYSYIVETNKRIAQMNNIARFGPTWTISPFKGTTASLTYNAMFAPESTPTRAVTVPYPTFSRNGHFRGHYLQAVVKHQFNKYLSGHLWAECVQEDNYYAQRDLVTFVRCEVMFTF